MHAHAAVAARLTAIADVLWLIFPPFGLAIDMAAAVAAAIESAGTGPTWVRNPGPQAVRKAR